MGERLRVDPPNVNGSVTAWDVRTGVAVTFRTWIDVMTSVNAHDIPWTTSPTTNATSANSSSAAVPADFDRPTTRIG
ncbi:MAG TPA: hypothetical protein VIM19_07070 [Actinomycetes bacterium]